MTGTVLLALGNRSMILEIAISICYKILNLLQGSKFQSLTKCDLQMPCVLVDDPVVPLCRLSFRLSVYLSTCLFI